MLLTDVVVRQTEQIVNVDAPPSLLSQTVDCRVVNNLTYPAVTVGIRLEGLGLFEYGNKTVLNDVLGRLTVLDNGKGNGQHSC